MTHPFDKNIMTTLAGLNLALSYENAAVVQSRVAATGFAAVF